nr:coiled-coil domain-containing protein 160 isoform X2 [Pelodiscus sinensis]|eukprot:XP_006135365.1 coiled-coil domain-containing protein 160 isoform X2 [Pelodiscus sinensis]
MVRLGRQLLAASLGPPLFLALSHCLGVDPHPARWGAASPLQQQPPFPRVATACDPKQRCGDTGSLVSLELMLGNCGVGAVETLKMENKDKHWVEKLFSPHFSVQDFFGHSDRPASLMFEKLALERAKRVEEIYNMAIKKIQEEKRLKRKECLSELIVREYEPNIVDAKINISKKETEGDSTSCGAGNLDVGAEESLKKTEGHCIWNAKELADLRQEMHKNHVEGVSLKLQLSSLNAELVELKAKYKKIQVDFENAEQELLNSKKEIRCKNTQLQLIQRDSLKKDVELQALKQHLHEKSANIRSLNEELLQARKEIQSLDLKNKDLQQEVKKLKQQHDLGNKASIEKVKLHYDLKIRNVQKELEAVKSELSDEKLLHAKNVKALEILRKHFSAQPLSNPFDNLRVDFL